jgi:hypothetical protein
MLTTLDPKQDNFAGALTLYTTEQAATPAPLPVSRKKQIRRLTGRPKRTIDFKSLAQ